MESNDSQDELVSKSDNSLSAFDDGLKESDVDDEVEDEASTSKGENVYEVEKIIDSRYNFKEKTLEFLIKWVGYPDSDNLWTPTRNLNCPERIQEFYNSQSTKRKSSSVKHALKTLRHKLSKNKKVTPKHFVGNEVQPKRKTVQSAGCSHSNREIVRKKRIPKKVVISDDDDDDSAFTRLERPKLLKTNRVAVIDSEASDIDNVEPCTSRGLKAKGVEPESQKSAKDVKCNKGNVAHSKEELSTTKILCQMLDDENDNGFRRGWTVEKIIALKKKSINDEAIVKVSHVIVKFKGFKVPQLIPVKIVMENAREHFFAYLNSSIFAKKDCFR